MSLINYFKETKAEMKHVSWPTRKQSVNYTLLVIAISIITSLVLGFFDFIFSSGLEKVIKSRPYVPTVDVSTSTLQSTTTPVTPQGFDLNL